MIKPYSYGLHQEANLNNNVIDRYKKWTAEEVRADLFPKRSKMICIFENIGYNINIASGIRSFNAFLGKEVYVVGRKRYDTRGDCGTRHYTRVFHADTLGEVIEKLRAQNYTIYAVDNIMEYNPKNMWDVDFPENSAFIFGSESCGLSQEAIDLSDDMIYIQMDGSVRSMNVACAASCIMSEYSKQYRLAS